MIVNVDEDLDRNKVLDEAIFLALCGRDLCKNGSSITGVVRLEMAYEKLGRTITEVNRRIDEGEICTQHNL